MLRRYMRFMPFALVVWFCRRDLERFHQGGLIVTEPFKGELVAWLPPEASTQKDNGQ